MRQRGSARRRAADHLAEDRPDRTREEADHRGAGHRAPAGADVVREAVGNRAAGDHRDAEAEHCAAVHRGRASMAEDRCQVHRAGANRAEPVLDHSVRVVPAAVGRACSQAAARIEAGGEPHGPVGLGVVVATEPAETARRPEAPCRAR